MKKNTMMRLASFLLVAVLISTSAISGTYAKYVTSDSASDTARVAKWGVTALVSGSLYGEHYNTVTESTDGNEIATSSVNVATSESGKDIVAPGTQNTKGLTLTVTGTPEVANKIEVTKTATEFEEIFLAGGTYATLVPTSGVTADNFDEYGDLFTKDSTTTTATYTKATAYDSAATYYEVHDKVEVSYKYSPVKYTWTPKDGTGVEYTDLETMYAAIGTYFNKTQNNANAPIDLSGTITWMWVFEDTTSSAKDYANGADTILGNLAAGKDVVKYSTGSATALVDGTDYNLTTNFDVTITVTQVD